MMFRFCRPPPRALASPRAGSWFLAVALLAAVVAVLIPPASLAADFTPDQRKSIESIIHDYLTKNPDVLLDALQAAEDKMKGDAKDTSAQALSTRRREIIATRDTPVAGHPHGEVPAPGIARALKANTELADALDIRGTPGFIVGNEIVPGAIDLASLKQLIATARKK